VPAITRMQSSKKTMRYPHYAILVADALSEHRAIN
jgi:hypothetical protein